MQSAVFIPVFYIYFKAGEPQKGVLSRMIETKLKPNIQLFAEGDPEPPATPPASEPAPAAPTAQGKLPKTFL